MTDRVLITGGLGFIGGEIAQHYPGATILDDLSSNVYAADEVPGRVNVSTIADWRPDRRFEVIIHCASPVGAVGVLPHRGRIASRIVADTQRVVDWCRDMGARMVNVSTSEVYGRSGTYREDDPLRVPPVMSARIEYAVGKIAAEACVRLTPGLRSITVRPFNVAGARQLRSAGFVIPTFAEQACVDVPLTVFGDGSQVRAFTAVGDVARFIAGLGADAFTGDVVNVGNPDNRTTIGRLAVMTRHIADSTSDIYHTTGTAIHGPDYAEAEGHVKLPDATRAHALGWRPTTPLEAIVADAVAHYRTTPTGALHAARLRDTIRAVEVRP